MGGIRAVHAVQRHAHRSDAQHRGEIETVEQALVEHEQDFGGAGLAVRFE